MRNAAGQPQGTATFKPVADYGSGFVTQIDIHPTTGRMIICCDAIGVYVRDLTDTAWTPLLTTDRMPSGEYYNSPGFVQPTPPAYAGSNSWAGYDAKIARSNPNRLWFCAQARCFRSDDGGKTIVRTAMQDTHMRGGEGLGRNHNSKMAVDTQNADVVVIGTHDNGLRVTTDAGATWTTVAAGTNTTVDSGIGVKYAQLVYCDPTGPVSGGIKQRWYAMCQGVGMYRSTTGPTGPYTQMTGGPLTAQSFVVDEAGNGWVASIDNTLWKYTAGGAWASVPNLGMGCSDVAVDPNNVNRVVVSDLNASFLITTNGGTSWQGGIYGRRYPVLLGTVNRYSTTVPSLNYGRGGLTFTGMITFDPLGNRLFIAEGTGVMFCTPPTGFSSVDAPQNRWDFYEISEGIKELIPASCLAPPGGNPIFTYWDKPTFPAQDANTLDAPIRSLPLVITSPGDVQHGWDVSYAADNPQWLAMNCNWSGERSCYSTDGGQSWTLFPTTPPFYVLGQGIAVGNTGNVILMRSGGGWPVYTKNGGNSWAVLPFPGLTAAGVENGFGLAYYYKRKIITYDIPGAAFYLYNYGAPSNAAATQGVWKSTNQGDTWTRVYASKVNTLDAAQSKLRAVPGQAGNLFFTCGNQNKPLRRSTDGGVTWTDVSSGTVTWVDDVGFGKPAPDKTYPTVFIDGKISGVYGIWRSDDNCASWIKIGDFPMGNFDPITVVSGDPNIYGRVYIGTNGSGFYFADYNFPIDLKP